MLTKGIAVAGNLIVDYIKIIESYPAPEALTTILSMERSVGGLACNCSLTLAKLDPDLSIKTMGIIGRDDPGDYIMSRFNQHSNIDTSHILRLGDTAYTDVMTEKNTSRRTFFTYMGANAQLIPEHFDFSILDADILHIGYILLLDGLDAPDNEYPTAMCKVLDMAQKAGIKTSIDVVSEEGERFVRLVPPALKYVDYCCINEYEASRTTGVQLRDDDDNVIEDNLPKACQMLMDMGVRKWVVIHMPELSCGLERDSVFLKEASRKIPEGFKISSVGAGDAFCSGILYGAYNGWSLEKSLYVAGNVAAYSLSGSGGADAIKPLDEILIEMEKYQ
ncbi:MAG: carbohydrate kinase family protein [Oscillospiraceae bacterium]|jgi:sugar/nucleoside kinase (ribokinase family)|nr:carbohydrate kinase family protein [Oscillospiraceae bacterium]